jgi:hypothetical protein
VLRNPEGSGLDASAAAHPGSQGSLVEVVRMGPVRKGYFHMGGVSWNLGSDVRDWLSFLRNKWFK